MGVNISTAELGLATALFGGIGHISDAMSPYLTDSDLKTRYQKEKEIRYHSQVGQYPKTGNQWFPEEARESNRLHAANTMSRKKGTGLVFANVMEKLTMGAPTETLKARLEGVLDGGIDGITLSAGLHAGSLKLIEDHPRFRDAAIGIIVSSVRALRIFLRSASRLRRLPDYIIVEGPLAGGHLGFSMEDWQKYDLKTIAREVIDYLKTEELDIPVIPAGGIFSGTDAVDMIELGASAVQVATRLTISRECGLPEKVKYKYLRSTEDQVVVNMTSPTGYPMRMLLQSPCLSSNIRPNCEALGYLLDGEGKCAYHDAYQNTGFVEGTKKKLPVVDKMCICFHFMKMSCFTCGHYVFRLKETTTELADGTFYLPAAEEVLRDYLYSTNHQITKLSPPEELIQQAV